MIRPFEEVNKDWTFFDWDEWDSVCRKIGEDKFEEIKDDLYDILEHIYGAGFSDGFIDARHCWYKYADKIRDKLMTFYKDVMLRGVTVKDVFHFVTSLISMEIYDIINKDKE